MRTFAALLLLALSASVAVACVWVERVDASFVSQNGLPISGGTVQVTYQKNVAGTIDGVVTAESGPDGVARITLCDDAPGTAIYSYTVVATEPYGHAAQTRTATYAQERNGVNNLTFIFQITLYNMTILARDSMDGPATGVNVSVSGPYPRSALTDRLGVAWFILPPGAYSVSASIANATISRDIALSNSTSFRLAPPPPLNNTLRVTVYDDYGARLENVSVAISSGSYSAENLTNSAGIAEFPGIRYPSVFVSVSFNRTGYYSGNVTLQNMTELNVSIDRHPPAIGEFSVTYSNLAANASEDYEITFNTRISDSGSAPEQVMATLHYTMGNFSATENFTSAGNGTFLAKLRIARPAPFTIRYWVDASDAAGNSVATPEREFNLIYTSPPATPIPATSTPQPGAATPTPKPPTASESLPEPLRSILQPVVALLSSLSAYMWVTMFLVVLILGGAVFVFISVQAFFYARLKLLRKKP